MKNLFSRISNQKLLLSTSILAVLFSCAHEMSPTGGPEDKTGPTILATLPQSGAVGVDRKSRLSITFSKWISKPSALKSISILPPLLNGSKIKIKGRQLFIDPLQPFAEATTYHVVLTSGLMDLHNNPIAATFTLVFSTGSTLDSGKVSGCVIDAAKRYVQPTVALFSVPKGLADTQFFRNPDYLTQGDSAGYFSIENVKPGMYQLLAFVDKNGNRRLDPGVEDAYSPLRQVIVVSKQTEPMMLYHVESDTAATKLKSVKPLSSKVLMCLWSRTIDSLHGCSEPAWSIIHTGKKEAGIAVTHLVWFDNRTRNALLLPDTLSIAQYQLIATFRRKLPTSSTVIADTLRFNGANIRDTVRPALLSISPTGGIGLLPDIRCAFTKPTQLSGPLALVDSLRDTVPLNVPQQFADTVALSPARRLHPGSRYRFVLLKGSGRDLAGNMLKPRDTSDTVARPDFTTLNPDSLALSLKGCAPCLTPDKNRKWQFLPFSGGTPITCADSSNCFKFDSISAGKGFVGYFTDENHNNIPDKGTLSPFNPPEPYVILPDTVEARARWEIEGVVLKPCERCQPHKTAAEEEKKK